MTEAAIDPGFSRDLYISLGEQINNEGGWGCSNLYQTLYPLDVGRWYFDDVRWVLGSIRQALFSPCQTNETEKY